MSAVAIVMMLVAMVVVWGGLATAVVFLLRNPGHYDDESFSSEDPAGEAPG
ncbi:methionine/alanine import family NSS transporter small subunit [Georgenia alba]|uniref:Methionine/alanine import family NSS transporter small subunit n=1 Tax=Georgenia alba TaxID=2233858 RepID=A0ABW2QB21_9MICO